ncbi:unnamed protein product [Plutella xylostella]|uniref:(diamondback moth) hypothetical protein n=1 Tax=Plutella xylostella TaxID=51655 RepID=A0A8S4G1R9_PLUXY|nr:unnamed protein product [Plutella xylostella]
MTDSWNICVYISVPSGLGRNNSKPRTMKTLILLTALFIGLTSSAPTTKDAPFIVTSKFFDKSLVIYKGEYDIVDIVVPLNDINFEDGTEDDEDGGINLFFTEADIKEDGKKDFKGIYYLNKGNATKILDNGVVTAVPSQNNKNAYFGAKDGLYSFDAKKVEAKKYGPITDSIIGIGVENGTDTIYILKENKELFKVTENGTKTAKVEEAKDVVEFVVDYENNLYFYDESKTLFVVNKEGIKKIENLPVPKSYMKLIRPLFFNENSVPILIDEDVYTVYANGTVEPEDIKVRVRPTAFGVEPALLQYYAHDKKIYEYNMLVLVFSGLLEELKDFLSDITENIQNVATQSRSELGSWFGTENTA